MVTAHLYYPKERAVDCLSEAHPVIKHDNKSLTCIAARKQLQFICRIDGIQTYNCQELLAPTSITKEQVLLPA
jgi:hypothetical protein